MIVDRKSQIREERIIGVDREAHQGRTLHRSTVRSELVAVVAAKVTVVAQIVKVAVVDVKANKVTRRVTLQNDQLAIVTRVDREVEAHAEAYLTKVEGLSKNLKDRFHLNNKKD